MKRIICLAAVVMLLVPAFIFAGGGQEEPAADSAPAVAEPATLKFALPGNPDSLDPPMTSGTLTFQVCKSIYDTLAEPDKDSGKLVPALAESWTVSDDNLSYTFNLRKGVKFHNGDTLTSADVKATFERIMDEEGGSVQSKGMKAVTSIETPDESTVVFNLSEVYAPFLGFVSSGWCAVLPKSLIDSGHNFDSEPVGTGPFKFVEWVRDNKIILEKNADYWMAGLPMVDNVEMYIIPETSVQVQSLMAGQVDVVFIVDTDSIPMLEANPDVYLQESLTSLILVMAMNCENPVLSNVKVRQAINYAIDKQKILDIAYGGGKPINTFMDRANAYYNDVEYYTYNPEKAKALLKEAGVGDEEFELFLPQNYALHVTAGEMYQEMLSDVGLNVKIQLVDWSTWISDVYKGGKYDMTVIGHTGKLDPDGTLNGYGAGKYVKWNNEETAALLKKAATVVGYENRKPLYDQALDIMAQEVPFVYLGSSTRQTGIRNNVEGFVITPKLDTFDFRWTVVK
ncbi:MAG: ABC transporter substrate-binding protein [Spirochaetales bacterium]|uniref:ABC transporter substrate-binding protein n=1 Tax=Candidatus Thalassospirochaeta sargassi TaxID=3119039 RepID=A0AAJ1IAJ7_9SPIO|nr:ABC transporter substrate-binding protein [Spirochaetales bacterium]